MNFTLIVFIIMLIAILYFWWKSKTKCKIPHDLSRRPFTNDEKIAVTEKTIKRFGKAQCWHCGKTSELEYDHVKPLERGGNNGLENLQLLCRTCNASKRDRFEG